MFEKLKKKKLSRRKDFTTKICVHLFWTLTFSDIGINTKWTDFFQVQNFFSNRVYKILKGLH